MAVATAARSRVFISYMILTINKLSIHKISCFYDNLNNLATNRSTTMKTQTRVKNASAVLERASLWGMGRYVTYSSFHANEHIPFCQDIMVVSACHSTPDPFIYGI